MNRNDNFSLLSTHNHHFSEILSYWTITFKQIHPRITISGSPQRSIYRIVVEDEAQQKYILEQISENNYQRKRIIAQTLSYLSNQGIDKVNPYLSNNQDEFITKSEHGFWQLQLFINGINLDRPSYVFDEWRGKVLAEFLINLWKKSLKIQDKISLPFFSLKKYVVDMFRKMEQFDNEEYQKLGSVISYLASDFLVHYEEIPARFCHGDFHPLNIIWGKNSVNAVIDWEFMGEKIEIYDMANLLGCLGFEEPTSLVHDFALTFIKEIRKSNHISKIGFHYLFDCMMALRFAWLAEWLRTNDKDMIQLEIDFLHLLHENKEIIKEKWADI
ncbi:MAG: aminoglycoside phosphotransferase family protein [Candidatus Thermoplasmatota archaeon]|nr:aminoglycoside phosphotransferase family protein [Candidatus Thermoplasmatota archaeon]MBS3801708.1 aminoglycoside phosphotransferase family protein [Candidatus Thermoplasmatota archaeon]